MAAHLIYEGRRQDGLRIVEALRARHDGARRNPWDEFECGHHYARALASWSVLLALSGYAYSAPEGRLRFKPSTEGAAGGSGAGGAFRCFFSTGTAWGLYTRSARGGAVSHTLDVRRGTLSLRTLEVTAPGGAVGGALTAGGRGRRAAGVKRLADGLVAVDLGAGVTVAPGQPLRLRLRPAA